MLFPQTKIHLNQVVVKLTDVKLSLFSYCIFPTEVQAYQITDHFYLYIPEQRKNILQIPSTERTFFQIKFLNIVRNLDFTNNSYELKAM